MTRDEFFAGVCRAIGLEPTPWRLDAFNFWAEQEGMPFDETHNPLATTQYDALNSSFDNGNGPGNWNSVPVRVYADANVGIRATANTLLNGYYPWILKCFADQRGYEAAIGPRDFTSWVGSESYGRRVVEYMNSTTADKGETDTVDFSTLSDTQIDALFEHPRFKTRMDAIFAYQFPLLFAAVLNNGFSGPLDDAAVEDLRRVVRETIASNPTQAGTV